MEPPRDVECPEASPEAVGVEATTTEKTPSFDEPIHLLRPSEDHRSLVVLAPALQKLRTLGPVAVLSVVGNQRGGKSTLMNLLHSRRLTGFQTGHYMDPQTHGLWVWPKPHPRRPGLTLLLVDSEGLDSPHVPQHYNWLISAVTLLMSDVYMYQTKGSIEQSSAERLDMILKVAEQLGKAGTGAGNHAVGTFLWLLRDHQLQMKNLPKQELVEKLDPSQVRALSRCFGDFDCVPLPRPAGDSVLREMDQHGWQDLDGDFKEEFVVLERRLLELLANPRTLFGQDLTGEGLAELLRQYLSTISQRTGALADICEMPTQRQMLQQLAGRRAMEAGVRKYEEHLTEVGLRGAACRLPISPADLLAGHAAAAEKALLTVEGEAQAAGLESDEVAAVSLQLQERLAAWEYQPVLTAGEVAAGSEEESAEEVGNLLEVGSRCRRRTPTLSKSQCLKGGLLLGLWKENARRSLPAHQKWMQRTASLGEVALNKVRSSTTESREVSAILDSFYGELQEALAEPVGDKAGSLGPWALELQAQRGSGELQPMLLRTVQQADGLVMALAEASLSERAQALQEQITKQCTAVSGDVQAAAAELREKLEATKAELVKLGAGLAKVEESGEKAATELKEAVAQAEARACSTAVQLATAQREESLQGLRQEVREALRNLKAATSREIVDSQTAIERSAAEAAARATEATQAVDARAREAAAALHGELEAQGVRMREDMTELRRTFEAAEARLGESLRGAETTLRERFDRALEACQARGEAQVAELQTGMKRLHGKEDELRGRLDACLEKVEVAGSSSETAKASLEALQARLSEVSQGLEDRLAEVLQGSREQGSALDALQARVQHAQEAETRQSSELESMHGRLGELSAQVTDFSQQDVAGPLEEKLSEASARMQDRLSEVSDKLFQQLSLQDGQTQEMSTKVQTQASQLRDSLQALENRCLGELDARSPHIESHCQEAAERLLAERLRRGEAEEAARLDGRLRPLTSRIASLTQDLELAEQDRRKQAELMARHDFQTLWESLAHLASRLTDIQEVVDNLSLKSANLVGS